MNRPIILLALIVAVSSSVHSAPAPEAAIPLPAANALLKTLRKEHPRLLATREDFARLKQQIGQSELLAAWHRTIREQGEKILGDAPSKYEIPDGLRLLSTSRRVLHRVQTLGLLYQLDGEKRWVDRAWKELEAAAAFQDWNPRHFLDTAEMTHAFAIGYDWLHAAWTAEQRTVIRTALVEKGLKLGLGCYRGTAKFGSWMKVRHNWNQVCNGGIGIGALAVADEEPELAAEFLRGAIDSIQLPMREFAPDGAWSEGPGYWNYATIYNVAFLAALESALGTDFGLSAIPGFADAGMFPLYATGPLGRTFNYADGSDGTIRAAQMFWLARKFARPAYATYEQQWASPHPLDLLWGAGQTSSAQLRTTLPPDRYFRNAEVVTMRSAWDDRNALFVGFKAGDNKANHSNLDIGTFVLDALGVRWGVDLGADNYNLPGYFGKQRWTYYRLRAEGHNTLVINPGVETDQDPSAATKVTRYDSKPARAFAVADLTAAYAKHAKSVQRGIALLDRAQVLVQDEIDAQAASEVWWFFHTAAGIEIGADGRTATLRSGDAKLDVRLLAPAGASFTKMAAAPLPLSPHPEKQAANEKIQKLAIQLKNVTQERIAVLLTPVAKTGPIASSPEIVPLARW